MANASSKFFKVPRHSVRGKHTSDPGFERNNHWVVCDRCGCDIRYQDARPTWDNLLVCPDDWEPRHEQDFVRGRPEHTEPRGQSRPPVADVFIDLGFAEECDTTPAAHFGEFVTPNTDTLPLTLPFCLS